MGRRRHRRDDDRACPHRGDSCGRRPRLRPGRRGSFVEIGASKDNLPALAAAAMADVCAGGSPREATLDDVIALNNAVAAH